MTKNTQSLDRWMLDFRRWAERVIYHVEKKHPKATVNTKILMTFYAGGLGVMVAAQHFIQKHQLKGGS